MKLTEYDKREIEKEKVEKRRQEILEQQQINTLMIKNMNECPLRITRSYIDYNAIDNPEVYIAVKNTSSKTIDAFTVYIYCYDNFNKPVNHYLHDINQFNGLAQYTVKADSSVAGRNYRWTLHGYENTTKFVPIIKDIHFTDNTTWESPDKCIPEMKKWADENIVAYW